MTDTRIESERKVLLDLADRCEREEASIYLDADVARALSHHDYKWWRNRAGPSNFTSSIDAAVTLRPSGYIWDVTSTGTAWCMDDRNEQTFGKGKTPALALCAAFLRSRAQEVG